MRIVSFKRIKEFSEKYNDAETALNLWYYTVTDLAAWNKTKVLFNLSTNIETMILIPRGIQGGIFQAILRYIIAKNSYEDDDFAQQ